MKKKRFVSKKILRSLSKLSSHRIITFRHVLIDLKLINVHSASFRYHTQSCFNSCCSELTKLRQEIKRARQNKQKTIGNLDSSSENSAFNTFHSARRNSNSNSNLTFPPNSRCSRLRPTLRSTAGRRRRWRRSTEKSPTPKRKSARCRARLPAHREAPSSPAACTGR